MKIKDLKHTTNLGSNTISEKELDEGMKSIKGKVLAFVMKNGSYLIVMLIAFVLHLLYSLFVHTKEIAMCLLIAVTLFILPKIFFFFKNILTQYKQGVTNYENLTIGEEKTKFRKFKRGFRYACYWCVIVHINGFKQDIRKYKFKRTLKAIKK